MLLCNAGNVIYSVPRRFPSLARVVRTADLRAAQPVRPLTNSAALHAYEAVVENGPDSAPTLTWATPPANLAKRSCNFSRS